MTVFFQIMEYVARFIEMFMCCVFCGTFLVKQRSEVSKRILCVWSVIGMLLAALVDRIQIFSYVNSILVIFIFVFIQLFIYKMRVGLSVLLTLIYSVILTAVDFMIAYFSAFVLGFDVRYLLDTHGLGRLAWILLSKAILILIVITINKIFEKTMIFIKRYVVIMCIYSIFLLILIFVMIELNIGRGSVETELFLTIFFIASIVIELLMFYFVIKTGEGHEQKRQAELIELKNNMLQKSLDETEQAFKLWRSSVHDYKNNIIALRQLVNDGKIKEVSEYLNHESELIDKKMFYIRTGSSVVDTIVNTKQNFAEEKGITFVVNAIIPGKCIISELDMASILGNLIDNAIEACEGENEPYIDVTIRQEKTFIVIKIINKYSREFSNNLKTTKNKKMFHGIGIGSVKSIVEKYEGKFSIEKKGNEVVAKIVMSNF